MSPGQPWEAEELQHKHIVGFLCHLFIGKVTWEQFRPKETHVKTHICTVSVFEMKRGWVKFLKQKKSLFEGNRFKDGNVIIL